MINQIDNDLLSGDPNTIQRQLGCRAAEFMRTGKVLASGKLMELYAHRRQIKPGKAEAKLILASMLCEDESGLKSRRNELGWFWFRHYTSQQLGDLLAELAQCKHGSVSVPATTVLAHVPTKKTFTALLKLVTNVDVEVASEAVKGLGQFPASQSLPKLRIIANYTGLHGYVRRRAVAAIGKFRHPVDLPLLRGLAADPSADVRWEALEALSAYQCPEDAAIVRKLAHDRDEHVRYRAIAAIWQYGQPEDRCWLLELVNDPAHPHRAVAVESLAEFKNPADLPLFRKLTGDQHVVVRSSAASALGKFQHPADVELLKRRVLGTRSMSVDALLAYPANMVAGAIRELAAVKSSSVQMNLAFCLGDWRHPDAPKILRQVVARAHVYDTDLRAAAAAALGTQGKAQDLPLLKRMSHWDMESVRREAVWAVAKYRRIADIKFLQDCRFDPTPAVRTVAAMAMARIMKRGDLERWLHQNFDTVRFETLVEVDFALYAPRCLVKTKPRLGNEDVGMALGIVRSHCPEW